MATWASRSGSTAVGGDRQRLLRYLRCHQWALPDPTSPSAEKRAQHGELCDLLRGAIAGLSERERTLVTAHYLHDKPLKKAGHDLGISKLWASRLHAQAIGRLRNSIAPARLAA